MKDAQQVSLRLTFDVTFEEGESLDENDSIDPIEESHPVEIEATGRELLADLVKTALNRGMVTGETSLVVADHAVRVDRIRAKPVPDLTDEQILSLYRNPPLGTDPANLGVSERIALLRLARCVQDFERARCAELCEVGMAQIKLQVGEMSAQESRTVCAVLETRAAAIRGRAPRTREAA